ncbi:M28 family metallopeptidase [Aurantiacibacter marinus]|uniref:Peptidase M28 n=1 Tax=Aurantiacibacter marinus TaxID=874156 RepID=A0A0H0XQM7_9SPHN|nr:M28 family metallopeptidase [Aurantiacibacter marinus]KLI64659.1 peptidase M28 [Aurantiacibacter marinus]
MFRILAPAALIALTACTTEVQEAEPQISLELMQDVTRTLSSDAFEGREPGTPGGERTVAYLIEQFQAAGLQPGNAGSWVQEVPLVEMTSTNFTPLTVGDLEFEHGSQWVGVSYPQVERTEITDSELVFVGYGINAPERGWNDYEGLDMAGKTALILVNDPDYAEEGLEGPFNGRAMTYYGRWSYKYEEAARQGATAAIIIHEDFPASYGWNVVEGGWTGAQLYADTGDGGADATAMNGWMTRDAAAQIASAEGLNLDELIAAASQPGFEAIPLSQSVSASFDSTIRRFTSSNVIGILPGNQAPTEYILHTAHWDHLGRCGAEGEEDQICNGAVDNATGTAALVALAAAHAEAGPTARTQVFLAVTAEESGLLGSEYYGANPVYPLDRTVAGVNIDALYVLGKAQDVTVIGGGKSELDGYLADALAAQGRTSTPDAAPQAGRYYRSDHFSLAKRGVPMFYIKSGQTLSEGGAEAGEAAYEEYNTNHYHAASDEYSEDWDWTGVMQDLNLYFSLARALGDTGEWPNWNEGDEFRAIRDASCASDNEGC